MSTPPRPDNDYTHEDRHKQTQRLQWLTRGGDAPDYNSLTEQEQAEAIKRHAVESTMSDNASGRAQGTKAAMEASSSSYKTVTKMLAQLNESMNANKYILSSLRKELNRVRGLNQEAQKEVYKAQQRHLLVTYKLHYTVFVTGVIVFSMVGAALLAMCAGGWWQGAYSLYVMGVLIAVVVFLFSVTIAFVMTNNARRRKFHWNQFYWGAAGIPDEEQNEGAQEEDGECDT